MGSLKKQCEAYLEKHGIEETVNDVLNSCLRNRPDDPYAFLSTLFREKSQVSVGVTELVWKELFQAPAKDWREQTKQTVDEEERRGHGRTRLWVQIETNESEESTVMNLRCPLHQPNSIEVLGQIEACLERVKQSLLGVDPTDQELIDEKLSNWCYTGSSTEPASTLFLKSLCFPLSWCCYKASCAIQSTPIYQAIAIQCQVKNPVIPMACMKLFDPKKQSELGHMNGVVKAIYGCVEEAGSFSQAIQQLGLISQGLTARLGSALQDPALHILTGERAHSVDRTSTAVSSSTPFRPAGETEQKGGMLSDETITLDELWNRAQETVLFIFRHLMEVIEQHGSSDAFKVFIEFQDLSLIVPIQPSDKADSQVDSDASSSSSESEPSFQYLVRWQAEREIITQALSTKDWVQLVKKVVSGAEAALNGVEIAALVNPVGVSDQLGWQLLREDHPLVDDRSSVTEESQSETNLGDFQLWSFVARGIDSETLLTESDADHFVFTETWFEHLTKARQQLLKLRKENLLYSILPSLHSDNILSLQDPAITHFVIGSGASAVFLDATDSEALINELLKVEVMYKSSLVYCSKLE